MLVAFHLPRRPMSVNAKFSQGYVRAIADAARSAYAGPMVGGPLYSRIVWFHKYRSTQGDTDNIIKKIHDALIGIVFEDDRVITHTMAVRVDATEEPEIAPDPLNPLAAATLVESLAQADFKDGLYVEVGLQRSSKVQLEHFPYCWVYREGRAVAFSLGKTPIALKPPLYTHRGNALGPLS